MKEDMIDFAVSDPEQQIIDDLRRQTYGQFFDDDESLNRELMLDEVPEDERMRCSVFAA